MDIIDFFCYRFLFQRLLVFKNSEIMLKPNINHLNNTFFTLPITSLDPIVFFELFSYIHCHMSTGCLRLELSRYGNFVNDIYVITLGQKKKWYH